MQALRRLYLYAMSGITLAVISAGLVILIDVIISGSGILQHSYDQYTNRREQLSQAIAMLAVGVPVWSVHWHLVQRGLAPARPDRDAERNSTIRAIYLTLVLVTSLGVWVSGLSGFLQYLLESALTVTSQYASSDPVSSASSAVMGFMVWLYHGIARRRDLSSDPVAGPAAWIPRLYLYAVPLVSLVVAISSIEQFVTAAFVPARFDESYARISAIQSGVAVIAWGLVWLSHWGYASRLAGADDWRGVEERVSRVRLVAFVATIVVATGSAISGVAGTIQGLVAPVIGRLPFEDEAATRLTLASLAGAIPWAIAWWAHLRWLRREPAASDPLRARHQARLVTHGMAAVGVALGTAGVGWLLGMGIDIAFGGERMTDPNRLSWTFELAQWLPMAMLGLGVWAWQWPRVLARRRSDPVNEANSMIRRAFLYLTLAGALVVVLAGATLILYRLVGTIIGATLSGNAVSALSTPIGALVAAAICLGYHGVLLRADQEFRPAATPMDAPAGAAPRGAESRRTIELVGPEGADLNTALAAARAALPVGIRFEDPGALEQGTEPPGTR